MLAGTGREKLPVNCDYRVEVDGARSHLSVTAIMWDAFEKQQTSPRKVTQSTAVYNQKLLADTAAKNFRMADFTGSGKIDDDETLETLDSIASHIGYTLPPLGNIEVLLAKFDRATPGKMQLAEFVDFVKVVVDGGANELFHEPLSPPAAPSPPAEPPSKTPAPPALNKYDSSQRLDKALSPQRVAPLPGSAAHAAAPPHTADTDSGNLRVRVVEAVGLPPRADGTAYEPYTTIAVTDPTRRRTRRTGAWGEAFDFERASARALVAVDVWDSAGADAAASLLGKAVLSLAECRPGVPHVVFHPLLEGGELVLRVLFNTRELPSDAEEQAAYEEGMSA